MNYLLTLFSYIILQGTIIKHACESTPAQKTNEPTVSHTFFLYCDDPLPTSSIIMHILLSYMVSSVHLCSHDDRVSVHTCPHYSTETTVRIDCSWLSDWGGRVAR